MIPAWLARAQRDRAGSAVEYALLASLIAAVIATIVGLLGQEVLILFEELDGAFG